MESAEMFYKTITTLVIFALVPHFSFRIYLEKIKCAKAEKGHALLLGVQILAFVITMIVFFVLANGRSLSEIGLIPRSIAFSLTWLANPIGLLYVVGRFIYYGSFSFLIFSRAISFFLLITGSWVIFFFITKRKLKLKYKEGFKLFLITFLACALLAYLNSVVFDVIIDPVFKYCKDWVICIR